MGVVGRGPAQPSARQVSMRKLSVNAKEERCVRSIYVVWLGSVEAECSVTGTTDKNKNTGIQFVASRVVLEGISCKADIQGDSHAG